jgi:hypothetical protein
MVAQVVSETSDYNAVLTRLIAEETSLHFRFKSLYLAITERFAPVGMTI